MPSYDFCKNPNCGVQRHVEGFTEADYFKMGWIKEVFRRFNTPDEDFFIRIEYLCPDCSQKEIAEDRRREAEGKALLEASRRNDPTLYERTMRERAS